MENRTIPRVKTQAREKARLLVYVDEAGFGRLPATGQTWSLRGQTPLLEPGCRYQPLAVISAVTEAGGFYYAIPEQSFKGENVAAFLRQLSNEVLYPLLVIGDNASIHRAKEVKDFLVPENAGWIHLEAQPGYSPELNADEQAWNWMKYHQLKNVCCKTLNELKEKVQPAAKRLKSNPQKVRRFFAPPELGFFMKN